MMPLPLIPILLLGGLALLAASGKKKTVKANGDRGQVIPIDWEELVASPEIQLVVGDELRVKVPNPVVPYEWTLYTEAIEGEPIIVVTEENVPVPEPAPGYVADHIFHIEAHAPGRIKADFIHESVVEGQEPGETASTILVIT